MHVHIKQSHFVIRHSGRSEIYVLYVSLFNSFKNALLDVSFLPFLLFIFIHSLFLSF